MFSFKMVDTSIIIHKTTYNFKATYNSAEISTILIPVTKDCAAELIDIIYNIQKKLFIS